MFRFVVRRSPWLRETMGSGNENATMAAEKRDPGNNVESKPTLFHRY